jgi:hypothetical protein
MDAFMKTGEIYTAKEVNGFIGGKHQGGIRYSGDFPNLDRIGVIVGGGKDAIYPDELRGETVRYIGEGQEGDQKLAYGNRALVWAQFEGVSIHVYVSLGGNRYKCLGPHRVASAAATIAPDSKGSDRGAFVFELVATRSVA